MIRGPSTVSTSSLISPSSSSSTAPRPDVVRQLLVVEAHARRVAQLAFGVEDERVRPATSSTLPSSNLPMRIFGPCRSAMIATSRPELCARLRARASRARGGPRGAVREIEAHDVDAGGEHARAARRARCRPGRAWRRFWWSVAWWPRVSRGHRDAMRSPRVTGFSGIARASFAARRQHSTAGSVLPSRNSRNAPPPVEM